MVVIQDKASVLASLVAAPRPGDSVLDLCAAPGSKTAHLAELMENDGAVYSVDKSSLRMALWKREMSRLGVEIAHPLVADSTKPLPIEKQVNVVILDPPCSNTGTFWKSPAAKWRVTPERVRQLAGMQSMMLENASQYLRKDGCLVYSTCTILPEENEYVVDRFLRVHPDFQVTDAKPRIGLPGLYGLDKGQRLYPHIHDCNGHFIAKMMRTS